MSIFHNMKTKDIEWLYANADVFPLDFQHAIEIWLRSQKIMWLFHMAYVLHLVGF